MAKKKKGLYYNRFMNNEYDPDALVQDYAGLLMLPVPGHVYVIKTIFGRYRIVHNEKDAIDPNLKGLKKFFSKFPSFALKFTTPFSTRRLIKNTVSPTTLKIDDNTITGDGVNVEAAKSGFKFRYETVNNKEQYKKVFNMNGDTMANVEASLQQILSFIVNRGNSDDVRKTFNLDFSDPDNINWPSWVRGTDRDFLTQLYKNIEKEYGVKVFEVMAVDYNEPASIVEARDRVKVAESDAEAAEIKRKQTQKDIDLELNRQRQEAQIAAKKESKIAGAQAAAAARREKEVAKAQADAKVAEAAAIINDRMEALKQFAQGNNMSEAALKDVLTSVFGPTAARVNMNVSPSVQPTAAPAKPAAAPLQPTVAPVQPTAAPAQPAAAPVQPTAAPAQPAAAPVQPTAAPAQPAAAPVQPTAAPVQPTAAPAQPAAAPVQPAAAPVQPTAAPVQPTAAPVQPAAAPVQPTAAPVQPAAAPVQPTAAPATRVPVKVSPVRVTSARAVSEKASVKRVPQHGKIQTPKKTQRAHKGGSGRSHGTRL